MPSAADPTLLPILVIDDDSALIRTLADIFRIHGYQATTASTGAKGLQLAEAHPPALAVVDLRLPDMDGVELAAKLHELSELTQVVVLTGNASVESAVAAMREHSVDYLLKPVKIEELLRVASVATERFQHISERKRAEQALEARARQQAAVAQFGQQALDGDDVHALIDAAVARVAETLDVPHCAIHERRAEGLQARAWRGWPTKDIPVEDPAALLDLGAVSGTSVEIPGGAEPYGVLSAHDTRERAFTQDDAHFLQAIAHIVGTAIQRNRTDAAFRQAQRLEAVGRLASGVAHDFNNMLTAISGYAEMVRATLPLESDQRADVDQILKAALRAAGLTKQLLAFSRQQVLQPRPVNLNEIVVDMEKMVRRLTGENIALVTSLAPDLGLTKADPGQIEQVILNLCVNARDAMPNGGTLAIETSNATLDGKVGPERGAHAAGEYVMMAVTDTGMGMDAETKARIYEPFFSTKGDKGTGLGLATVYGIVKQTGGEIWVYSEVGRGTTFKIYLPRMPKDADKRRSVERPAVSIVGTETVLIAEDDDGVRTFARRLLEAVGYTVLAAAHGGEALRVAQEHPGEIHLLLTDMVMPGISGPQLADELRATRPALRVLFLSGYTDATVQRAGRVDPAAHFLQKPFSTQALGLKVREVLDATLESNARD